MRVELERKAVWRHSVWQARSAVEPRRWPAKLSLLVLGSLCVGAWIVLGGALHMIYRLIG